MISSINNSLPRPKILLLYPFELVFTVRYEKITVGYSLVSRTFLVLHLCTIINQNKRKMKFLVTIFTTVLFFVLTTVKAQEKTTITATVVNVLSDEGKVGFALYNKETFMKQPIQAKDAKIVDGKSTVVFENVPSGEYAILCYHDKNGNNRMDFEPNGMPLESFGASNNVMSFGPPNYDDAKFTVSDKKVSLEIKF